jgi:serine/threonine protein kinase/predicted Zn-dependent protease
MVGKTVSHYRIVDKLGSGGMGDVYQARDLHLDRFVALKFLSKDLLLDEEARQRFKNEARIISTLDHPNIATVHEIEEIEDSYFISIAYYEGETLEERLKQGALSLQEVYSIGRQIASGLAEAHEAGITHRDIKPSNIIITKKDQVKIIDFGVAKSLQYTAITQQDTTLGTVGYMSPEQIEGKTISHRSDIFSLGVLLYTLITGEMPFAGEYSISVSYSILNEDPPDIRDSRPDVPEQLENLVLKALAKDPEQRFQSAGEMASLFEAMLAGETISEAISIPRTKSSVVRRRLGIFVSAATVVALAALLFFFRGPSPVSSAINSIAVMPFSYQAGEPEWRWLGSAVTELINDELGQYPSLQKLSAQRRKQVIRKLGFNASEMSLEQSLQVAREGKMNSVLIGSLRKDGDMLHVQAKVVNANDNVVVAEFAPFENEYEKLDEIAGTLSKLLMSTFEDRYQQAPVSASRRGNLMPTSLDALRYYIEGRDAAYDLRYEDAIAKLTQAIRFDSTFIQSYYFLRWVYSAMGNKAKAKEILAKGRPLIDNLSVAAKLNYLSEEAKLDHRWQDWLTYIEQRLNINPDQARLQQDYGWILSNNFRQIDAGITAMEKGLQLDSTYSYAYYQLAYIYLAKGEKTRALRMVDKYIALNPTKVNPLTAKAGILRSIGDYDGAVLLFERVMDIQGDAAPPPLSLARTYLALGKVSQALNVLEDISKAEQADKYHSRAKAVAARAYSLLAKYEQALEIAEEAIGLDSTNLEGHWLRGRILVKLGDKKKVEDQVTLLSHALDKKANILKDMWLLYHLQGEVALYEGNFDAAIEGFQKAVDLSPKDRSFYLMALANAYQHSGQYQKAVEIFRSSLEFNPNNAKSNYLLASTYEKWGKSDEALPYYRKVEKVWAEADETLAELKISKNRILALKSS